MTHPCAVCPREIDGGLLMCHSHWRLVPKAQQRTVSRLWRAYLESPRSLVADRWAAYMVAQKAASESVRKQIQTNTPNPGATP